MSASDLKISVITVCFNAESTIRHTIHSVNEQTYLNVEHVFIDGASKDGTLDIIRESSSVDKIVVSEPDNGIYDALNKGLAAATGDVVGFLHADDFYADADVLRKIAWAFETESVDACYADLHYVSKGSEERLIRHWKTSEFSPARLKQGWMPPHPTLYVRPAWYQKIGGFDTSYLIAADYYSMLQLFSDASFDAHYIPEVLVKMRIGGASNRSLKNILQKSREDYNALRQTGVGGLGTLLAKNFRKAGQFW